MKMITFLMQLSWRMVAIAAITGFISGRAAGQIALISPAVSYQSNSSTLTFILERVLPLLSIT